MAVRGGSRQVQVGPPAGESIRNALEMRKVEREAGEIGMRGSPGSPLTRLAHNPHSAAVDSVPGSNDKSTCNLVHVYGFKGGGRDDTASLLA